MERGTPTGTPRGSLDDGVPRWSCCRRSRAPSLLAETIEYDYRDDHPGGIIEGIEESADGPSVQRLITPRRYHLDWMRIVSIYLVICYHVVQALDWVGLWCGHQKEQSVSFRCMALQLGMPLFFHISGRAQSMAKVVKLRVMVVRRSSRLLLPFLICYVLLIPPWQWIHQRDTMEPCVTSFNTSARAEAPPDAYKTLVTPNPGIPQNLFMYEYRYWTFDSRVFSVDPAWLWFLPVLYVVTVSSTPLCLLGEERRFRYLCLVIGWWVVQAVAVTSILNYSPTFAIVLGLGPIGTALAVILVPFPPKHQHEASASRRKYHMAIRVTTLLHIITTLGLVSTTRYSQMGSDAMKAIPQLFMYSSFYVQGYFAERWWPVSDNRDRDVYSKIYKLGTIFVLFLIIFYGAPIGAWEFNSWPVYSASFHSGDDGFPMGYVLGTWAWIYIADALFEAYANDEIDPNFHHHASASTIVVYIFHWVFIKVFVWFVIRDLDLMRGTWKYFALIFTFLLGAGGSLLIYMLLLRWPAVGQLFGVGG